MAVTGLNKAIFTGIRNLLPFSDNCDCSQKTHTPTHALVICYLKVLNPRQTINTFKKVKP